MIKIIRSLLTLISMGSSLIYSSNLSAKGLEDFVLADEEQTSALKSEGVKADLIYFHKDWQKRDSAPLIQLKVYTDPVLVGDYSLLYDSLSGKSENYKFLILDEFIGKTTQKSRVISFELFDDLNAFMVTYVYYESEAQSIWMQYQLQYWSSRKSPKAKCVIASDVEERVSAYYGTSISDSLIELLVMCNKLFPKLTKEDPPA